MQEWTRVVGGHWARASDKSHFLSCYGLRYNCHAGFATLTKLKLALLRFFLFSLFHSHI